MRQKKEKYAKAHFYFMIKSLKWHIWFIFKFKIFFVHLHLHYLAGFKVFRLMLECKDLSKCVHVHTYTSTQPHAKKREISLILCAVLNVHGRIFARKRILQYYLVSLYKSQKAILQFSNYIFIENKNDL